MPKPQTIKITACATMSLGSLTENDSENDSVFRMIKGLKPIRSHGIFWTLVHSDEDRFRLSLVIVDRNIPIIIVIFIVIVPGLNGP